MAEDTSYVVMAYIFHKDKLLLTYHRNLDKWLPVGGHVERGESFQEALRREVREEVSLTAVSFHHALSPPEQSKTQEQPTPFHVQRTQHRDAEETILEFKASLDKAQEVNLQEAELSNHHWFTQDEISDDRIPPRVTAKANHIWPSQ